MIDIEEIINTEYSTKTDREKEFIRKSLLRYGEIGIHIITSLGERKK